MSAEFDHKELTKAVDAVGRSFEEYKKANDLALDELRTKGAVDPVLEEKLKKLDESIERNQERLDEYELAVKRSQRIVTDEKGQEVDLDKKAQDWLRQTSGDRHATLDAEGLKAYEEAFENFLRMDERKLNDAEFKALSVGSDPDGGYTVHPDMSGRVSSRIFETSPMRAYASVQVISTDALTGPIDNDEAACGWVNETDSRSETDTPEMGEWRIPVHELYAAPRATQKLLDDSAVNVEAWLSSKIADKFARTEATAFVTGDGVSKPRGFLTYDDYASEGVFEHGKIEQFDTGVNGGFAAAPNGGDVLINALYGLKAGYRNNAVWFMNRATTKMVRKLKDSDGAYLWMPGIAAGQPSTVLGYPMAAFEDMPDPATGSLSIAVGDMRETYQIVDRMGIRLLRDPYTAKPYVIFYSTKRVGGDVTNFEALKLIKFAA